LPSLIWTCLPAALHGQRLLVVALIDPISVEGLQQTEGDELVSAGRVRRSGASGNSGIIVAMMI
jgi:hypothetical protein